MNKQPDIPWKKHELTFRYCGEKISADVFWWSKSYYIIIKHPCEARIEGGNLMNAMPARFTIDNSSIIPRIKNILILDKCKKLIKDFIDNGGNIE